MPHDKILLTASTCSLVCFLSDDGVGLDAAGFVEPFSDDEDVAVDVPTGSSAAERSAFSRNAFASSVGYNFMDFRANRAAAA